MIEKSTYKLGEYQIAEYEDGALQWAAHHGFGAQRSGRCLIIGDILVIGESSHEEIGYLKGEFLDRLRNLPNWNKTNFYCFASELLDVSSGKSLNQDWSGHILSIRGLNRSQGQSVRDEVPGTFRLGEYKVTVRGNSQISWQALEGRDKVVGGECIIQSGILFLGRRKYEKAEQSRREFLSELSKKAPWKRTRIWSHSFALRHCESPPQTGQTKTIGQRGTWSDHGYRKNAFSALWKGKQKTLKSLWPPGINFKTPSLPRPRLPSSLKICKPSWSLQGVRKICFILLIPLLLTGLLFGLILSRSCSMLRKFRARPGAHVRVKSPPS